jgi:transcriptional repressor NF-X1
MERNRKLAEALDIDTTASFHEPENVKGGYQFRTLDYFNNNRTWCTEIEGVFKDFLSSKSMRHAFKPMTGHKREFVHELAEAYGLDSDSIDHEPYRRYFSLKVDVVLTFSVEIYRSNRTAVPRYTLSEAAKLKNPHGATAATYASSGLVQMRKYTPGVAYNAIFLEGVKGTVLQADLQTALNPLLNPSKLVFSVKVLQLETILTISGSAMARMCYFFQVRHPFRSRTSKLPCTV